MPTAEGILGPSAPASWERRLLGLDNRMKDASPATAVERMKAALDHRDQSHVPRGELWLGSGIFHEPWFDAEDSLRTHTEFCRGMGMDFLSLPMYMPAQIQANYRRFNLDEIEAAVVTSGLFTCVVIDGPFQRAAERPGDLSVLSSRCEDSSSMRLREMASTIEEAIAALTERGVNAVVIADDIAYRRSTYASPQTLREHLFPLYTRLIERIHGGGAYALFHSDGNIAPLISDLVSCGFDGLAGCEPECLDLASLKRTYGSRLTFMTGIRAQSLEPGPMTPAQKESLLGELRPLAMSGGFVLCSACGVNSREAVESLKTLYAWIDEET
jgi:uroporphyrinogen decarboxylase